MSLLEGCCVIQLFPIICKEPLTCSLLLRNRTRKSLSLPTKDLVLLAPGMEVLVQLQGWVAFHVGKRDFLAFVLK